jgi:photosystem II stability/assembly factor-like uncharacterized protein
MSIWKELGPTVIPNGHTVGEKSRVNVTGRITAIVTAGETIYVGTAQGGIWKSINGGKYWTPTSDKALSLAIGALAMDPNNPEVLYAGTGEGNFTGDSMYGLGILKTTNGGQTWELKADDIFKNDRFFRIAVNPRNSNYIFAATRSGIYRSTDAGESWSILTNGLPSGPKGTDIVLDPKNPDTAYAAFWSEFRSGIFKTTNATDATPYWTSLSIVVVGRPFDCSRIALGISPSLPQRLYALMADRSDDIDIFYHTGDGGESWTPIQLPDTTLFGHLYPQCIGTNGSYNLDVAVNPKNPDIVYLLGTSIWKAVRDNNDQWNIKDVGSTIHADNHALAFNTLNNNIIYAGNDGGIYKSINGGDNWDDSINKGLSITQFEFMEQDPKDEKRIIAGTQDNGTVIYEGKPEFYHSADGDGGFVCIDPNNSQIVWHTFNGLRPEISTEGGKFQTWKSISESIKYGEANFYPPMTLDKTNANNIAIGGRLLYIDYSKGEGGWTDRIDLELPLIVNIRSHVISAINFVNSNLIYVGTNGGCVYRVTRSENKWTPQPIHSSPFPDRYVWDIATLPSDQNKIIAVVSGFDTPHVFRGEVSPDNKAKWTDISGTGTGRLPNIPVNALAIDDNNESTMYIGTDVGVFGTLDGGNSWIRFSNGLPTCQVYDMRLKFKSKYNQVLRAATHGRGMWQRTLHGLRMAWKGAGNGPRIYWSIFDGTQWSGQEGLEMRGTGETIASPALAEFKGKLYMAWVGRDGPEQRIHWTTFDGMQWSDTQVLSDRGTNTSPALVEFKGKLYIAWTGAGNDFKIYWSSFDGMQWSGQQVLSDRGTNTSPALVEFKGKLYMAWTGFAGWKEEETRNIYWSTYDGTQWSPQQRVLEYEGTEATIASPALAEFNGKLYMAWTGYFSSNVKWSTFDGTVPPKPRSPWSPQQSIDSSLLGLTISPALAKFDGKLYMAWVGPEHDPRIYWGTFDGTRWSPQQIVDSFQTSASPALCQY